MSTTEASDSANITCQPHNGVTWIDTENPSAADLAILEKKYKLHPLHLNESTQKVQHLQVEREDNYLFLLLHTPFYNMQADKICVNQVGIFLGKDYVVTIRTGDTHAITDLFKQCQTNFDQTDAYFKDSAYLVYMLISRILNDISNMTDKVVEELDEIEDQVFDNSRSDAQRIGKVRQKIVRLSRIVGPKRLILEDLAQQINAFTGKKMAKYYSNNTKMVNKLWEVLEEAKETVEIYKDADFTTSTEKTNRILAILTLIFTFTIPVTVLGTMYGMNVPLPGGIQTGAWAFFGTYTTVAIVVAFSVVLAIAMYLYFRKKKWF
jgi:magnesium transporter